MFKILIVILTINFIKLPFSLSPKTKGHLYLIPSSLGDEGMAFMTAASLQIIDGICYFIVEHDRSARRFLRSIGYKKNFDEGHMYAFARDEAFTPPVSLLPYLLQGNHVGVISEAGCPGIADPGAGVVIWAHQHGVKVIPLVGPSSLFLALMASGLNGQQFAFHGYLPIPAAERKARLKQLEEESLRKNQTQLFMETPYRNMSLLKDLLTTCRPADLLCIASAITLPDEMIRTMTVGNWKNQTVDLRNKPTVFLLLAK
ncbi:MAG: SAM-dependent methyltransferase [Chitinophagales bacterium]|nr:SAM-dependent methyltransferase [Chitinophagales bacterium]